MSEAGVTDLTGDGSATPGTFVQLGSSREPDLLLSRKWGQAELAAEGMAPELALVLSAVLLALTEQVSQEKLTVFNVADRQELPIHALAMAFRADDTGLTGDVFEWALLLALNSGDPAIRGLIADALTMAQLPLEEPQAVLVAAERGRLVSFSPDVPERATLATDRRGRPPHVANLMKDATTANWKADLLIGSGDRWISASLKSNPAALGRSLRQALETPHPPRIGITAGLRPSLIRDPATKAVLVQVPVKGQMMMLAKLVLREVKDAFTRHLSVPDSPLGQDVSGVGLQLYRWRDRPVGYAVATLLAYAENLDALTVSAPSATGASVPHAQGALVVVNTIRGESEWHYSPLGVPPSGLLRNPGRYSAFDPID